VFWEKALNACQSPESDGYFLAPNQLDNVEVPTEGAHGTAAQDVKNLLQQANTHYIYQAVCGHRIQQAHEVECPHYTQGRSFDNGESFPDTKAYNEAAYKLLQNAPACWRLKAEGLRSQGMGSLNTYHTSRVEGAPNLQVLCKPTSLGKINSEQCYLLNTNTSTAVMVDPSQRKELPVTSTKTDSCSGYIFQGQEIQAAHCREGDQSRSITTDNDGNTIQVTSENLKTIESNLDQATANSLPKGTYHDLATRTVTSDTEGKSAYWLTQNSSLEPGCKLAVTSLLECSSQDFRKLQGVEVVIQSSPAHYVGTDNPTSLMVSRGKAFYDPYNNQMLVNAGNLPGGSGGVAYIPAGQVVNGFVLDRPLILGPVSGSYYGQGNGPKTGNVQYTNNLAVIPLYDARQIDRMVVDRVDSSLLKHGRELFK